MWKIVIVGGGAGGLALAIMLGQQQGKTQKAHITLVDKSPVHIWKPLLHEYATDVLEQRTEEVYYSKQGQHSYFHFAQGQLNDIDRAHQKITITSTASDGISDNKKLQIDYDVLVLAVGSQCNDFGIPGVKEHCICLDTPEHAKVLRDRLLVAMQGLSENSHSKKIRIAIAGAGATGVELIPEIYKMLTQLRRTSMKNLHAKMLDISLIEAAPEILPALPPKLAHDIKNYLEHSGAKVHTELKIARVDECGFYTQQNNLIAADIMIWSAGVKAPDFLQNIAGLETNRLNQLAVTPMLQTTRDQRIFAIGDCASCPQPKGGTVPATAQAANQMAAICAHNITAFLNKRVLKPFQYKDRGTIISLGHTAQGVVSTPIGNKVIIKGQAARGLYRLLYRLHQSQLYGPLKTFSRIFGLNKNPKDL